MGLWVTSPEGPKASSIIPDFAFGAGPGFFTVKARAYALLRLLAHPHLFIWERTANPAPRLHALGLRLYKWKISEKNIQPRLNLLK